jgi:hypothetical protein
MNAVSRIKGGRKTRNLSKKAAASATSTMPARVDVMTADPEILELAERWREIKRREERRGLPEDAVAALIDEERGVVRQILRLPARSLAGLAAKAEIFTRLSIEAAGLQQRPAQAELGELLCEGGKGLDDYHAVAFSMATDIQRWSVACGDPGVPAGQVGADALIVSLSRLWLDIFDMPIGEDEKAIAAHSALSDRIETQILETPARSIAGLAAKLRVAARGVALASGDGTADEAGEAGAGYIKGEKTWEHWAVASALADAERLAGS